MNERTFMFTESHLGCPAATIAHPDDVVADSRLGVAEKRAILASWGSDARAVENAPHLRRLDSGAIVELESILRALRSLDGSAGSPVSRGNWFPSGRRRRGMISSLLRRGGSPMRSRDDDDDDPPPAPAGLSVRFRASDVVARDARPERLQAACAAG